MKSLHTLNVSTIPLLRLELIPYPCRAVSPLPEGKDGHIHGLLSLVLKVVLVMIYCSKK